MFLFLDIRHLTGEVAQEWQELEEEKEEDKTRRQELLALLDDIVPYLMGHNAESEACDILMETERLAQLAQYVDKQAFARVCLYLKRWGSFSIVGNPVLHLQK